MLMLFPGQGTLEFPTTCPLCEHTPLETASCTPNKSLRNTMRVWLQKQKKKEEAKAVSQVATPVVEATPAPSEVQPAGDAAEKSAEGLEGAPKSEGTPADEVVAAADDAGQTLQRVGSTASQPNEVS